MRRILDLTARNFIDWGGFYDIKPIEKGTPIPNEDLFGTSHIDHIRMRRTIRKWSHIGGVPNPYEYINGSGQVTEQDLPRADDRAEWEPLPGCESSVEDVPVPMISSVEVTSQPQYPPLPVPYATPATPIDPIIAPCSPSAGLQKPLHNSPPPILPSDVRSEASGPTDTPTQNRSPRLGYQKLSGVPSRSVQGNKAVQLKAARNLVKRAQQQQNLKKQNPTNMLNSKPPLNSTLIRPPIQPSETNSTSTERLTSFFKTWF